MSPEYKYNVSYPPVGAHQSQDYCSPSTCHGRTQSTHQQAGKRPGILGTGPTSRRRPALRHRGPISHLPGIQPDPPVSLYKLWDTPDPISSCVKIRPLHQWANTRLRTPLVLTQPTNDPIPILEPLGPTAIDPTQLCMPVDQH